MNTMSGLGWAFRLLLLSGAAATTPLAQTPAQSPGATIIGTVRDSSGAPIARTRLTSGAMLTVSDTAGRFALGGLRGGPTTLLVRRLGYEPVDLTVDVVEGATRSLMIVMNVLPQDLPGMTTSANTYSDVRLRDFYRHRQTGIGYFFDRKEIESKNVQRISDLLRRLPGTRMLSDRSGRANMRMGRASGGRDCPPDVWVDGVRATGMLVDDVPIGDVEALELYRGPAGMPPEMNSRFGNPSCGALIIWTRLPG